MTLTLEVPYTGLQVPDPDVVMTWRVWGLPRVHWTDWPAVMVTPAGLKVLLPVVTIKATAVGIEVAVGVKVLVGGGVGVKVPGGKVAVGVKVWVGVGVMVGVSVG